MTSLYQELFSHIDIFFAEILLKSTPDLKESAKDGLSYLMYWARLGHLCLDESIEPAIFQSLQCLPPSLLTSIPEKCSFNEIPLTPIVKQGSRFYLQRSWLEETFFLKHYLQFIHSKPAVCLDDVILGQKLDTHLQQGTLNQDQADAIYQAVKNPLFILMGGPGTGKTYTAGILIQIILDALPQDVRSSYQIALAAPTGKAAANLQNSLQKAIPTAALSATTVHQLLNFKKHASLFDLSHPLTYDLIMIDESSMLDAKLMGKLFSMLKKGARLILIGDPYQLPPVESGGFFADLVETTTSKVTLKTCVRTELKDLIQFAHAIRQGDSQTVIQCLQQKISSINAVPLSKQKLLQYAMERYIKQTTEAHSFRILTPLRQGEFGTEQLNRLILEQLIKKIGVGNQIAIPILITKNDYKLGLFNGDMGILVRKIVSKDPLYPLQQDDYVYFPQREKMPAVLLSHYEWAYCLSVHKSQGSEFDHVVLLVPPGCEHFGRTMLYTGATRAKKKLEVWGDEETIVKVADAHVIRMSSIKHRVEAAERRD